MLKEKFDNRQVEIDEKCNKTIEIRANSHQFENYIKKSKSENISDKIASESVKQFLVKYKTKGKDSLGIQQSIPQIHYFNIFGVDINLFDLINRKSIKCNAFERLELFRKEDSQIVEKIASGSENKKVNFGYDSIYHEGKIFIVGGSPELDKFSKECFEYSFCTGILTKIADLKEGRRDHCLSSLNGFIFCVGGRNENGLLSSTERYNIEKNKWECEDWNLNEAKCLVSLVSVQKLNSIFCIGGRLDYSFSMKFEFLETNKIGNPLGTWKNLNISSLSKDFKGLDSLGCVMTKLEIFRNVLAERDEYKLDILLFGGVSNIEMQLN